MDDDSSLNWGCTSDDLRHDCGIMILLVLSSRDARTRLLATTGVTGPPRLAERTQTLKRTPPDQKVNCFQQVVIKTCRGTGPAAFFGLSRAREDYKKTEREADKQSNISWTPPQPLSPHATEQPFYSDRDVVSTQQPLLCTTIHGQHFQPPATQFSRQAAATKRLTRRTGGKSTTSVHVLKRSLRRERCPCRNYKHHDPQHQAPSAPSCHQTPHKPSTMGPVHWIAHLTAPVEQAAPSRPR